MTAAASSFSSLKGGRPAEPCVERCRLFKESPPPADWDGVFDLKQK